MSPVLSADPCRAEQIAAGWPAVRAAQLVDAPVGTRVWMPAWRSLPTLAQATEADGWVQLVDLQGALRVSVRAGVEVRVHRPGDPHDPHDPDAPNSSDGSPGGAQ